MLILRSRWRQFLWRLKPNQAHSHTCMLNVHVGEAVRLYTHTLPHPTAAYQNWIGDVKAAINTYAVSLLSVELHVILNHFRSSHILQSSNALYVF